MGFLSKVFGKKDQNTVSQKTINPELAVKIIQVYGSILENQSPPPGSVADLSKLPYQKEQIKQALIIGMHSTDDEKMREMMKFGFVELANWQKGVGDKDQGLDISKIDLNDDPGKAIEQFRKQSDDYKKWSSIVEAERESSEKDLRDLGLW